MRPAVAIITAVVSLMLTGIAMAYEEPEYQVLAERQEYEIRAYESYLVAETVVEGDYGESGGRGFRILAGYIFGDNQASEKMAMTAPVTREPAESVKMNMTVPVISERVAGAQRYRYQFVMERKYTRETLPVPDDERVTIREIPARTMAVHRYSGRWTASNFEKHTSILLRALERDGIEIVGTPRSAAYNAPFTPPFLRRNEILVEIDPNTL
ncbi:SOUL family heme-binding protein [Lentisalinibacter orientalis]|uniref:SOUL family heme-binding protein n=1 Tax=Lentisalinibacter orientalis TaxID=2992241 RepID=UPI00386CE809